MVKFVKVTEYRYGMPDLVAWMIEHRMWVWRVVDKNDLAIGWLYVNMAGTNIAFAHFSCDDKTTEKRVLALEFRSAFDKAMAMLTPIFGAIYFNVNLKNMDLILFLEKRGCKRIDQYKSENVFWVVLKYLERKNAILNTEPETGTVNFLTGELNDGNESINGGTAGRSGSDTDSERGHDAGNAGSEAPGAEASGAELRPAEDDSCR